MKDIQGYEGRYSVTKDGRVLAHSKIKKHHLTGTVFTGYHERWLKPDITRGGYFRVTMHGSDGVRCRHMVHRLVAKAYIPNPSNYPCVNHIDADPRNNSVQNLEWCTHKQNSQHMSAMGHSQQGEKGYNAKLTAPDVRMIRELKNQMTYVQLAKRFNVYKSTIEKIVRKETWKHIT